MKAITEKLIVTGVVRLAYPTLYKPRPNTLDPTKPDEYGVVVLFPKANTEFQPNAEQEIKAMQEFMLGIAKAKWGEKTGKVEYTLKDGDKELTKEGDPKHPGYFFMRCNAPCKFARSGDDFKPNVFDGQKKLMESGGKSGDWGKVLMDVFSYETPTGRGVTSRLKEVQFLFEDEQIGNAVVSGSGFDEEPTAHKIDTTAAMVQSSDDYDPWADQ